MRVLRSAVKRTFEKAAAHGGAAGIARRRRADDVLILAYHNVLPNGERACGDRSLHLPQAAFAAQLDELLQTHDIVPLRTLFDDASSQRTSSRPRAVITFDDAYLGAMTAGVSELATRDLPATVFVAPAFVGGGSFWWDVAAHPIDGLSPGDRDRALMEARGIDDNVRRLLAKQCDDPPAWARCASEDDIAAALASSRLTVASHTWSHPNLTQLDDAELAGELARPREWLARYGERALPVVSYPYGLADARVQASARKAGYTAGFMIEGGWTTPQIAGRFDVPRLNIPAGVSRDGFVLRAAGLLAN